MTQLIQVVKDEVFGQSKVGQIIYREKGEEGGVVEGRLLIRVYRSASPLQAPLFNALCAFCFFVLLPLIDGVFYLIFYCAFFYSLLSCSILFVAFAVAAPKLCVKFTKRCGVCLQFAYLN